MPHDAPHYHRLTPALEAKYGPWIHYIAPSTLRSYLLNLLQSDREFVEIAILTQLPPLLPEDTPVPPVRRIAIIRVDAADILMCIRQVEFQGAIDLSAVRYEPGRIEEVRPPPPSPDALDEEAIEGPRPLYLESDDEPEPVGPKMSFDEFLAESAKIIEQQGSRGHT